MKKILFIGASIFFSLGCNNKEIEKRPDEEIVAIYIQKEELGRQDILIIGKVNGDSIESIEDWDSAKNNYVQNIRPYLEKYSNYYIDNYNQVEKISIDEIVKKKFSCTPLTVGHSRKYQLNIKNEFSIATNYSDFTNHLKSKNVFRIEHDKLLIIKKMLQNTLISKGFYISADEAFDVDVIYSFDLDGDDENEVLVKATVKGPHEEDGSVLLVLNITDNYIKEIGKIDSWGSGYNLIGITDLNNNGIYELVFQGKGYESTGFEIYELQNGKFKILLHAISYGC